MATRLWTLRRHALCMTLVTSSRFLRTQTTPPCDAAKSPWASSTQRRRNTLGHANMQRHSLREETTKAQAASAAEQQAISGCFDEHNPQLDNLRQCEAWIVRTEQESARMVHRDSTVTHAKRMARCGTERRHNMRRQHYSSSGLNSMWQERCYHEGVLQGCHVT